MILKYKKWEKILKRIWILVKDPFRDGKLYLRKLGSCYRVKNVQSGDGLFLSSQHPSSSSALPAIVGDGIFLKQKGGTIFNGEGLIFNNKKNGPFKHLSILELLL